MVGLLARIWSTSLEKAVIIVAAGMLDQTSLVPRCSRELLCQLRPVDRVEIDLSITTSGVVAASHPTSWF